MTLPLHHPDDQLLIGYASGQERAGKSLLVATHLAYCPDCRRRVASYEALCGSWFEELRCDDHDSLGGLDALLDRMDGLLAAGRAPAEAKPSRPAPARCPAVDFVKE